MIYLSFYITGETTMSGYVKVESTDITVNRFAGAGMKYAISIQWLGNHGEIRFESHFLEHY